jgi:hypothetical protein
MLTNNVEKEFYTVDCGENVVLLEESASVSGVNKKVYYLVCDAFSSDIPVHTNDINASEIIRRICKI